MGRFERKIKKQLKKDTEAFDVWFEKNQTQLNSFNNDSPTINHENGSGTLVKNRMVLIPVIIGICLILCVAIFLSVIFNKGKNNSDLTFGDDSVYTSLISDEELQDIIDDYPFIANMQIVAQTELRLWDNDSLVFAIIKGELETEDDYYLISIQIEYDKNYEFGYKSVYLELNNKATVNNWDISYQQKSIDPSGLYVHFMRMEDSTGQVIYMEIHSFENDINYILNEFLKENP